MELFIQIRDGQPFEHPILHDNFIQAFPDVDVNNLSPQFARFERVEPPAPPSEYQKAVVQYGWVDGVVKDIWTIVEMTDEERAEVDRKKAELSEALARYMSENSKIEVTRV